MKTCFAILAAMMVALFFTGAIAQEQDEQQACQGDVFALCGEAVPDRGLITACLRKRWSEVSHECRSVLANYGRRHGADHKDRRRDDLKPH
jgi:hypothetical protein